MEEVIRLKVRPHCLPLSALSYSCLRWSCGRGITGWSADAFCLSVVGLCFFWLCLAHIETRMLDRLLVMFGTHRDTDVTPSFGYVCHTSRRGWMPSFGYVWHTSRHGYYAVFGYVWHTSRHGWMPSLVMFGTHRDTDITPFLVMFGTHRDTDITPSLVMFGTHRDTDVGQVKPNR